MTGEEVGSATWEGDLNFMVIVQPVAPTPAGGQQGPVGPPLMENKVFGSFRCTFTSTATVPNKPIPGGQFVGTSETGQGNAVGNFMGDYDPQANTIDVTAWIPFLTQANGTYTEGQGTSNQKTTPWSINVTPTPAGPGNPPPTYAPPPPGAEQSVPAEPRVLDPTIIDPEDSSLTLDLNDLGTQQVVQTASQSAVHPNYTVTATWTFNLVPPQYTIKVEFDQTDLDPTGNVTTTATITVTENGQPSQNRDVDITVCTEIGGDDGHIHDGRQDPCDNSRPPGSIDGSNNYPVTKTTDSSGKISTQYTSPKAPSPPSPYNRTYYISGTDDIKAVVDDPTIKDKTSLTDKQTMKTWVQGLEPMPGSADGSGGTTTAGGSTSYPAYGFTAQQSHGLLFYGTPATNQSLVAIANEFIAAQLACQNGDNGTYGQNPQGKNFSTPGPPKPIVITAMSLPWGGLSDIKGDWNPPHGSHNTGKVADITFSNFTLAQDASGYDMDRLLLLKNVIMADSNFLAFNPDEGGDMTPGGPSFTNPRGPHFHVVFRQ
jgi:hypothetical protein